MKKIFTFILSFGVIANLVNAQNFTLSPKNAKGQGASTKNEIAMNIAITNSSTDANDTSFSYEVIEVNTPSNWTLQVCDPEKCLEGSGVVGFKSSFVLAKNQNANFVVDFFPKATSGTGTVKVLVKSNKTQFTDTFSAEAKIWNVSVKNPQTANKEFSFYPNPAKDELVVKYSSKENIQVDIYNILGVKVKTFNMQGAQTSVNIEDLQDGIYFLRFKEDGRTVSRTFTKN